MYYNNYIGYTIHEVIVDHYLYHIFLFGFDKVVKQKIYFIFHLFKYLL